MEGDDTKSAAAEATVGIDVIAAALKSLPNAPGVYRMQDTSGACLYVGKARSLKKRVASYVRMGGHSNRIARMIAATATMEFVTTRTESEALLLEANLIKRLRPRYNVLLRDDKSFPYILIAREHAAAQILKHRGARNRKGSYFGPFASAGAVNRTINTLQRAFLLRSCSDSVYDSRTRPCLLYQIKRCSAPCTGEIAAADYADLVAQAERFLRGESLDVRAELQRLMLEAADSLEFEQAARYRDRLAAVSHVQSHQGINPEGLEEADVFAAHQEGGQTCIQVFFFRTGQNWGNRPYYPRADRDLPVEEVLDAFIAQFYDDKPVPRLLLLSHDVPSVELLGEALSLKAERRIDILTPKRGEKHDLMAHALANAREALGRRMAESASQKKLLEGLGAALGLARPLRRVEVYDNSHIQGASAVGAMIVAGPDGLVKAQYRTFNMKTETLAPGDDYAMMREMLMRRFKRLVEATAPSPHASSAWGEGRGEGREGGLDPAHGPTDIPTPAPSPQGGGEQRAEPPPDDATDASADLPDWPDLVLIDGGKGQLAAARGVLDELGITSVPLAGVAKGPDRDAGREHIHFAGRPPFMLEPRDPVLYFIQRLRDEAHRFAIGSHRQKRKKTLGANPLDDIAGIGPTRKRELLKHFGSAKAVSRAGVTDLTAVGGISAAMARAIHDFFHEGKG